MKKFNTITKYQIPWGMNLIKCMSLCALLFCMILPAKAQRTSDPSAEKIANAAIQNNQGVTFMENRGQVLDQHGNHRPDILFLNHTGGMKVAVLANGITYQFENATQAAGNQSKAEESGFFGDEIPEVSKVETYRLDMKLLGANPAPVVVRENQQAYFENYYNISSAPDGILGVKSYSRIRMKDVYPGIDWVIYTQEGSMKYDFVVRPGADPSRIRMRYEGAVEMHLDANGALVVNTPFGEVIEHAPVSFQEGRNVSSKFLLNGNTLSFEMGEYDRDLSLTVDPTVVWATYFGGNGDDQFRWLTTDGLGNIFGGGFTSSNVGIAFGSPPHQTVYGNLGDAMLVKFNPQGVRLWATYYGGTQCPGFVGGDDYGTKVACDATGNVYLAGQTWSCNNMATPGAWQTSLAGNYDGFIAKFNTNGVRQWGTYFGVPGTDFVGGMVISAAGNLYISGLAVGGGALATPGAYQTTANLFSDAYLARLDPVNGHRIWCTLYGGNDADESKGLAVDANENLFVYGRTASTNAIGTPGTHQPNKAGSVDFFVAKFNSTGTARLWGTYYGGTGEEDARVDHRFHAFTIDPFGNPILGGLSASTNISHPPTAHQPGFGGGARDGIIAKLNGANGTRMWGTYYGGALDELFSGLSTDAAGNVYATGTAPRGSEGTFVTDCKTINGTSDIFIAKFSPTGVREWGTVYGGTTDDQGYTIYTPGTGTIFLAGTTSSPSGFATPGAWDQSFNGGNNDAFLAQFTDGVNLPPRAVCQNLTVSVNNSCQAVVSASSFDNGSSDPNGDPLTFSVSPAGPYAPGVTNVVLTVSDGSCTATCSASVTAVDNTIPVITCPANIAVNNTPGVCSAVVSYTPPVGTDNCPGQTTVRTAGLASGSTFPLGVTTNTYTVTAANAQSASCSFTVTVNSAEMNVTGNGVSIADGDLTPSLADHTDFGTPFPGVPVTRTYTIQNSGQIALTVSTISMAGPGVANFTVGGISLPATVPPGGSTTFTVTFVANPIAVYNATVVINNTDCNEHPYDFAVVGEVTCLPAAITCPSNITVNTANNLCTQVVTYNPVIIGAPTPSVSYTLTGATTGSGSGTGSGLTFNRGIATVSITATNACGTANCTFTVTVNDGEAPSVTCPAGINLECLTDIPAADISGVAAMDNCDNNPSITHAGDTDNGASGCAGSPLMIIRTYSVSDQSGNVSNCTQSITVEATPILVSTSGCTQVLYGYGPLECADIMASATGGCGSYTWDWGIDGNTASINVCPSTTTTYWVTATDAQGCTAMGSIEVRVVDARCRGSKGQIRTGSKAGVVMCHKPGSPSQHEHCVKLADVSKKLAKTGKSGWTLGPCGTVLDANCAFDYTKVCGPGTTLVCVNYGKKSQHTECVKASKLSKLLMKGSILGPCPNMKSDNEAESVEFEEVEFSAFPNPFGSSTNLRVAFPESDQIQLSIFDITGQLVKVLHNGEVKAGQVLEFEFSPEGASGVYMATLKTKSGVSMHKKLVYMK